jgi:hypothetical protein
MNRALIVLPSLWGCAAQLPPVSHIDPASPSDPDALVYTLPRKRILVTFTAVKTTVKENPRCKSSLAENSAKALGLRSPDYAGPSIAIAKAEWAAYAVPDPAQRYRVDLPAKLGAKTEKTTLTWQPDGILTGASYAAEDRTAAIATNVLDFTARAVGAFAGLGGPLDAPGKPERDLFCEGQLSTIANVRSLIHDLHSGTDLVSKEVAEYQEAKLLADLAAAEGLFTGVERKVGKIVCEVDVTTEGDQVLFSMTPTKQLKSGSAQPAPVCRVPEELNLSVDEEALAASQVSKLTDDLRNKLTATTEWKLVIKVPPGHGVPAPASPEPQQTSYVYWRPAPATVAVYKGGEVVSEPRIEWIPQLGTRAWLPRYKGAKLDATLTFDATTGSLTSLSMSREPLDPSAVSASGATLLEKVLYGGSPADELAELQTELGILEAMEAINKARNQSEE